MIRQMVFCESPSTLQKDAKAAEGDAGRTLSS